MNSYVVYGLLIVVNAAVNVPFIVYLIRNRTMALNFAALQAAAGQIGTDATTLQTQAAASDDASNQAVIDSVTESLTTAGATLAALIVPPTQ